MTDDDLTAEELDRMATAYAQMARGAYAGRPEQGYCEERSEHCRAKAAKLRASEAMPA